MQERATDRECTERVSCHLCETRDRLDPIAMGVVQREARTSVRETIPPSRRFTVEKRLVGRDCSDAAQIPVHYEDCGRSRGRNAPKSQRTRSIRKITRQEGGRGTGRFDKSFYERVHWKLIQSDGQIGGRVARKKREGVQRNTPRCTA